MTGINIFDWDQHGRIIRQFYLAIDPATNGHKSAKSGIVGHLAMPTIPIPLLLRAWGLTINMDTFSTFIIVISLFVLFVFKYRIKNAEL